MIVKDLKKDFVENFIFKMIQMNAIYENRYLLGTSIARPCIAQAQITVAKEEGCNYCAHGATGKGNDQVRFELTWYALNPKMKVIAPWRMPEFFKRFPGRNALMEYAKEKNIPVDQTPKKPYSCDENLFHISYESGMLEDPSVSPNEDMFKMTTAIEKTPDTPDDIIIHFKDGIPVKVEHDKVVKTDSLELFQYLNKVGSKHGVGRIDIVENRFIGIKSRGVYETPGGTILRHAHLDIEGVAMDKEVSKLRDLLVPKFSELIYNGFWFSPEMEFIWGAVKKSQEFITGWVKLRLFKGNVYVRGRYSPYSLYNEELSSMNVEGGFNPLDSDGFIKINAIRLQAHHAITHRKSEEKNK